MNKYKGQLIGWDVVNENLHFNFFESKMGTNASALFYNWAIRADPATILFLNEYNTIEESADEATTPVKYLRKLKEMLKLSRKWERAICHWAGVSFYNS